MRIMTTLSKNIHTADEKVRYDAAVKNLLANRKILSWILKSCIEEFHSIEIDEIADKYIDREPQIAEVPVMPDETNSVTRIEGTGFEDVTITEGTVTFDIRFQAVVPKNDEIINLIINIEAQNDFYPGYPLIKRGLYYCSRMISSQYGTVFTKSHYEKIKKVYSIWICVNPPKGRENTITEYSVREKNCIGNVKEQTKNYDLLTVVMICLGHSGNEDYQGILRLLGVLLSLNMKPEEKCEILEHDFSISMTETLERQVADVCNLSKGVEDKGIEKGILISIKNLMETMKMTANQAMDALKIPEADQAKYTGMLK